MKIIAELTCNLFKHLRKLSCITLPSKFPFDYDYSGLRNLIALLEILRICLFSTFLQYFAHSFHSLHPLMLCYCFGLRALLTSISVRQTNDTNENNPFLFKVDAEPVPVFPIEIPGELVIQRKDLFGYSQKSRAHGIMLILNHALLKLLLFQRTLRYPHLAFRVFIIHYVH